MSALWFAAVAPFAGRLAVVAPLAHPLALAGAAAAGLVFGLAAWFAWRSARRARQSACAEVARLQGALRLAGEQQRLAAENVRDCAVVPLDLDGRVAGWNEGAERLTGHRPDQALGQPFSRFYPAGDVRRCEPERALKQIG